MERITFMKTNEEGKKIKCEVIATYHDDEGIKIFLFIPIILLMKIIN